MQQLKTGRFTPDDIEVGQTVAFQFNGVGFLIYGRIIKCGAGVAYVMTFGDRETFPVPHKDIARRVLSRHEVSSLIRKYSPPFNPFSNAFNAALGDVARTDGVV